MPKLRKTRLGGLGRASGLVPSGSEHVGSERRGEMERRRTVSEGDVNRVLRGYGLGGGNEEEGVEGGAEGSEERDGAGERDPLVSRQDTEPPPRLTGRWAWVRRWVSRGKPGPE